MEPPPDRLPELNLDIEPGARQRLETQYVNGIYVPLTIVNTYIIIHHNYFHVISVYSEYHNTSVAWYGIKQSMPSITVKQEGGGGGGGGGGLPTEQWRFATHDTC